MKATNWTGKNWKARFFTFWGGQAFSLIGSRAVQFGLVWWLTLETGSATVLAIASMIALIPEIALSPIAGAYVDRWNRGLVMIIADAFIALASLWLVYLFWLERVEIWHIYMIIFVRALGGSFHWPAMQTSTSLMVPKEQLTRVAGINQTMNGMLNILGPPLGAFLLEIWGMTGILLVDVFTALIAILPLFIIHIPQPSSQASKTGKKTSIWAEIGEALGYIRSWPGLIALIAAAMILKLSLTPASSLLPLLVREHFLGGAAQFSLVQAVFGMGIVIGGVTLSVWGGFKRRVYTMLAGFISLGFGFLMLGLTPGNFFWVAVCFTFLIGLSIPFIDGPIMAILQGNVAPEIQGRVFTLMGSLLWITSPLGLAIAGPVSDSFGVPVWYIATGLLCVVMAGAMFFIPVVINIEDNRIESAPGSEGVPVGNYTD